MRIIVEIDITTPKDVIEYIISQMGKCKPYVTSVSIDVDGSNIIKADI